MCPEKDEISTLSAERAVFYAKQNPKGLLKEIKEIAEESGGKEAYIVVNCSIEVDPHSDEEYAVFDKTFAEMQNYELGDIQFRFNGLKSIKQLFIPGRAPDSLSSYCVYFYDIRVNVDELAITQYTFTLDESDGTSFSVRNYPSAGSDAEAGDGK